jgi:CRISPR-associated endonuclease/helicase Cas3
MNASVPPDSFTQDGTYLAHLAEDGAPQPLVEHLFSVSRHAAHSATKIGVAPAGHIIGLVHDLGKYSAIFQRYLLTVTADQDTEPEDLGRGKIDHSTAGAQMIWNAFKGKPPLERAVAEALALCVASHHSGLIDCIEPIGSDRLSRRMQKIDTDTHLTEACSNADPALKAAIEESLANPALVACLKDRITQIYQDATNETIRKFHLGLLVRILFSCLIDADRTDTADSANPIAASFRQHGDYVAWPLLSERLERSLAGFTSRNAVDNLRKDVSDRCLQASKRNKGIFTLTVPTGGGKTLASLRFALNHADAWKMDRIIYVSPYTSIIDQNAQVVRSILEPKDSEFGSVVLEHHSNLTPLKQTWRSKILSDNWDAPIVFTTMVQLLETLFGAGTRSVRRMHQLANAVLIFDEVQTLPVRCVHLFNNAINYLAQNCGSSVVLCTATQPLLHLVDPGKGAIQLAERAELAGDVEALFAGLRRYETMDRRKAGGWEHGEVAKLAHQEAKDLGSCLVVVNTKKEALSIFKDYTARPGRFTAFHLSTNMCPAHRMVVLDKVKENIKNGVPVVCVSTQLIEAGVDIDFGAAIRALAGLDSLAQAAGRCNRNGLREMGRVHVVNLASPLPKQLSEIRVGQESTQRVLDESSGAGSPGLVDLSDPKMTELYFNYYFFARKQEMNYPVAPKEAGRDDNLLNMLSENNAAVDEFHKGGQWPEIFFRQSFMTAAKAFQPIDANTRGVIVPYGNEGKTLIADLCAAFQTEQPFKLLKRAQQFTVNVFPHVMRKLDEARAVREVKPGVGIICLNERYYSEEFGLSIEGSEEMEFQNA